MEAKIDKLGRLHIKRGSRFKLQCCPYKAYNASPSSSFGIACGDWCPLFDNDSSLICKSDFYEDITLKDERE